ncbi:SDR family NAD(P)-dependent oxidoreductase [Streptomyces sp. BRA346]
MSVVKPPELPQRIEVQLSNYPDLQGKTLVVTGGSRGIGPHTARAFAAQGAAVCAVGRDQQALDAVVADITTGVERRSPMQGAVWRNPIRPLDH